MNMNRTAPETASAHASPYLTAAAAAAASSSSSIDVSSSMFLPPPSFPSPSSPSAYASATESPRKRKDKLSSSSAPSHVPAGSLLLSPPSSVPPFSPGDLDVWPGGRTDLVKPHLLVRLESFVSAELRALKASTQGASLSRVSVYRQAFAMFASEFKSYKGFLHAVQNEYDEVINLYGAKLQELPLLQAEMSSLRKGSGQQLENLKRTFALEKSELHAKLKTQYSLHQSLVSENSSLRNSLLQLSKEVQAHAEKNAQLKHSALTLTSALVRLEDDNTVRSVSENSAQSEVLRLKSSLEKANLEVDRLKHAAVDYDEVMAKLVPPKALEEKEAQLVTLRKELGNMRSAFRNCVNKYNTLKAAIGRAQEKQQGESERGDGDEGKQEDSNAAATAATNSSSAGAGAAAAASAFPPPSSSAVVEDLVNQIERLTSELEAVKAQANTSQGDLNIDSETFQPRGNFFEARGISEDVPKFLRYEGLIRNWRLSKRECERAVNDVWIAKEEWLQNNNDKAIHLSDFIFIYLDDKYEGNQALVAEFGYNLVDALERYIADSDCKIFLKVLQGELAEEVRDDQLQLLVEIPRIMADEDAAIHSNQETGLLPIPIFLRQLRKLLSTKSDHSFAKLQKALQFEAKKGRNVAYNELFEEDEDGNQGNFCELLRAQHLEEIIAYDKLLRDVIEEAESKHGGTGSLPIATIREAIQTSDPDKSRAEINSYLARGADCTIPDVMEKEGAGEEVYVKDFVVRLRDGLLKRSDRVGSM